CDGDDAFAIRSELRVADLTVVALRLADRRAVLHVPHLHQFVIYHGHAPSVGTEDDEVRRAGPEPLFDGLACVHVPQWSIEPTDEECATAIRAEPNLVGEVASGVHRFAYRLAAGGLEHLDIGRAQTHGDTPSISTEKR